MLMKADIQLVMLNPPDRQAADKQTEELCLFLAANRPMPVNPEEPFHPQNHTADRTANWAPPCAT